MVCSVEKFVTSIMRPSDHIEKIRLSFDVYSVTLLKLLTAGCLTL